MGFVLAFSLQDQVEKYGAYVGIAAFLGLAVLSLLYFAQARELKRLRDWAGRAPERAQELEARVVAQAEEARRVPEPVPVPERSGSVGAARPVRQAGGPVSTPVPSGNGRQAGRPAPVPMGPRPAVAAVAVAMGPRPAVAGDGARVAAPVGAAAPAVPAELGQAGGPIVPGQTPGSPAPSPVAPGQAPGGPASPAPPGQAGGPIAPDQAPGAPASPVAPGQAPAGTPGQHPEPAPSPVGPPDEATPQPARTDNGLPAESPDIAPAPIPRATPRPQTPRPAAPLRATTARSTTVPPRRSTVPGRRTAEPERVGGPRTVMVVVIGALMLAAAAFAVIQILGGDDEPPPPPNQTTNPTEQTARGGNESAVAARPETVVVVLNGTLVDGLASSTRDRLVAEGYSEDEGMIRTGDNTDQQRQDSVVLYGEAQRRQARDVASILDIEPIEPIDGDTQFLANETDDTGQGLAAEVVVVLGADQAP